MRVTNDKLNSKARLINKLIGVPKGKSYGFYQSAGKIKLMDPNNRPVTPPMTKSQLYEVLDNYVKGMEDYRDRVKIRKRFK
jgi:hypothetical protein